MLLRLAILDRTTPDLTRARSFVIEGIKDGFTASQFFDVRDGVLDAVVLDGDFSGEGGEGVLEAHLVEVNESGGEREVRQALFAASRAAGECCPLRFQALTDAAGKRYRLDLRARDFEGSLRLSLAARTARGEGGLAINGRPQPANLNLDASGAALYPLRNAPRVSLWWLMLGFAVIDACVGFILHSLMTARRT